MQTFLFGLSVTMIVHHGSTRNYINSYRNHKNSICIVSHHWTLLIAEATGYDRYVNLQECDSLFLPPRLITVSVSPCYWTDY